VDDLAEKIENGNQTRGNETFENYFSHIQVNQSFLFKVALRLLQYTKKNCWNKYLCICLTEEKYEIAM